MKQKIFVGAITWLILVSVLHIQLNIGWAQLASQTRILLGEERHTLEVGFIPVT